MPAYRELDEALGLTATAGVALSDSRRGRNTRHVLTGLLRQSAYSRLAGYEDVNDAERFAVDPAMHRRSERSRRHRCISQMGRFETAHRRHPLRIDTWSNHGQALSASKEIAPELNADGHLRYPH